MLGYSWELREEALEVVGNLLSGMNGGGGIEFGGGGALGGGGSIIIGGLDLSTTAATFEGVRDLATISSIADESVDSIDCLLSEADVRGREMKAEAEAEPVESLVEEARGIMLAALEGEGAATLGKAVVVGPAEGGGEMNWNCCEGLNEGEGAC